MHAVRSFLNYMYSILTERLSLKMYY